MRVERYEGDAERRGLTVLIVSREVLARVAPAWKGDGLFAAKMANTFGWMCVEYFRKFNDAPKKNIQGLFIEWSERNRHDKDTLQLAERFLSGLSDDYEQQEKEVNVEYELDALQKHFDRVAKKNHLTRLQGFYDAGNLAKFEEEQRDYRRVEIGSTAGTNMEDESLWESALTNVEEQDSIITFPGEVGQFYRGKLGRERLIAFQAPEKRGKSVHLVDMAWRALGQRRRVAFFEAGDMSLKQIMRRIAARSAKRPVKPVKIKWPLKMNIKQDPNGDDWAVVTDFEEREYGDCLNWVEAYRSYRKYLKEIARSKGDLFWLSCHSNKSLTVRKIDAMLQEKAHVGWQVDVIVIDYADILGFEGKQQDYRVQVGQVWCDLKKLSQDWHALVVTATQASAKAYNMREGELMGMSHFSENKNKNAQVDGIVCINQTPREKDQGIVRLNWEPWREGEYDPKRPCYCAGCPDVGNPHIITLYPERKKDEK